MTMQTKARRGVAISIAMSATLASAGAFAAPTPANAAASEEAPAERAPQKRAASLLVGGKAVGGYVPINDPLWALGGFGTVEIRSAKTIAQLYAGGIYANAKKNDTNLAFVGSSIFYRPVDVWAFGAGAGLGYRWSSGKSYEEAGHTYHSKDSDAPYAMVSLTPLLVVLGGFEIEGTAFIGRDITTPKSGVAPSVQPGGYLGLTYVWGVGAGR